MIPEIEIKLEIPASAASKVMRLPWLWRQASGEVQPARMVATYYDTPKRALRKRGVSLRIRRTGDKLVQTVKAAPNGERSPLRRAQWEAEVAGEGPELNLAPAEPFRDFSRRKLRKLLEPVFEVKVERSAYPVQSANSDIEVAIDRGRIAADETSVAFCEIELELKRGASAELARLGRRIAAEVPASLGLKSKADRGYALRYGEAPRVYRAEPVAISPDTRLGEAFQLIAWSCLRQFALNAEAVKIGEADGVHQMRIGLRRLRAAISVFGELLDGPETDAVKGELAWITDELGPAREFHVFIDKTLAPLSARSPEDAALNALCAEVSARRDDALNRARQALASDRYRELTLRAALWILAGEWADAGAGQGAQPLDRISPFARRTLDKRTARLVRHLERVEEIDDRARHKLRIRVKKLRYASEFFDPLFAARRRERKRFARTLERLQDSLGRMNDIAVHRRLGRELVNAWFANDAESGAHAAADQYALGFAIGQEQHELAACAREAMKAGVRLGEMRGYWD
jgi:inorganic triphosphatase YgiF